MEAALDINDIRTSHSVTGKHHPNFQVLDANVATVLKNIRTNSNFGKRVYLEEQKAQTCDRFLRGRQVAHMISEHVRVTGTNESILEFSDLMSVTLRGDDVQGFDSKWDDVLFSMRKG